MDKGPRGKLYVDESNFDPNWEDVLSTINIESLPIRYLKHLILNLKTKEKYIIDVQDIVKKSKSLDMATAKVNQLITLHKENIDTIDFSVMLNELQESVNKSRDAFTKKVNRTIKRKNAEEKAKKRSNRGGD